MKKVSVKPESRPAESSPSKAGVIGLIFILLLLGLFIWQRFQTGPVEPKVKGTSAATAEVPKSVPAKPISHSTPVVEEAPAVAGAELIPQPMDLAKKVVFRRKWNSTEEALTRMEPPAGEEGGTMGPHSLVYVKDTIYVLDSVANRLVGYDRDGHLISSVPLPKTRLAADLVADPTDSSIFVIDQLEQNVYKVKDGKSSLLNAVPLRDFSIGERFGYDAASGSLYIHSPERAGDVAVMVDGKVIEPEQRTVQQFSPAWGDFQEGNRKNMLLHLRGGQDLTVAFQTPILSVQEIATDEKGIVWVLYALEGDYRTFRIARVDPIQRTVGVDSIQNFWWAYEGVRHMTTTGNGVVLMGGSKEESEMFAFDYLGNSL